MLSYNAAIASYMQLLVAICVCQLVHKVRLHQKGDRSAANSSGFWNEQL